MADPQILDLTNDGPMVAFNARDLEHERYLWLGDLRSRSINVAYEASESAGAKVDIWWPTLAAGQLLWLEYVHDGVDANHPIKSWSLRDLDVSSRKVRVLSSDKTPAYGGRLFVERIRFDGQRVGLLESTAGGRWQIEIRDLEGKVQNRIPIQGDPFDFALVTNGVLYTTGKNDLAHDAVGQMKLWYWQPLSGSRLIGEDAFYVSAEGDLAAWMADPEASKQTTGAFNDQRIDVAGAPFTSTKAVSPEVSGNATIGIDGMSCGSGSVVWWERENTDSTPRGVLTLWMPGWSLPIQIDTNGSESYFVSVRGGWVVWAEEAGRESAPLMERIRGVPLSVLAAP